MTSAPATWYIGLYTVAPADDGTGGTEVTGGSYARKSVTNNSTEFPNATGANPSTKSNANAITFAAATASWGTVVAWGVLDQSSGGNLLYFGAMQTPIVVDSGKTFEFKANDINIELGDPGDTYTT